MGTRASPLILTRQLLEKYLNSLKVNGRKMQTIRAYRRCLEELYDFLPEGTEITRDKLEEWKAYLKESGSSDSSINLRMAAVNGLMKFCGEKGYAVSHERAKGEEPLPEMTRAEYLRFLSAACEKGTEQEYLLIKVFASIDIRLWELPLLTVEACRDGTILMPDERRCIIPGCLRKELLQYAERQEIRYGSIFVTRSGNTIDRSNVARSLRRLAEEAGFDSEKCCPTALQRMYRTTQKELEEKIRPIYLQAYNNLLDSEQAVVAWEGGGRAGIIFGNKRSD